MKEPLGKQQRQLLALFKEAIGKEKEAQAFYAHMAELASDPALERILLAFVAEEKRHEEKLLEQYAEHRTTGPFKDKQKEGDAR